MIAVDNAREVRIGSLQNVVDVDALEVWSDVRLRLYRGETGETGLEACQETFGPAWDGSTVRSSVRWLGAVGMVAGRRGRIAEGRRREAETDNSFRGQRRKLRPKCPWEDDK
jgi:hypothetical protein